MADKCYIFFSGYYSVAAASDRLTGYHISNEIVKAPVKMSRGCSFAIKISKDDVDMSKMLLNGEIMEVNCV